MKIHHLARQGRSLSGNTPTIGALPFPLPHKKCVHGARILQGKALALLFGTALLCSAGAVRADDAAKPEVLEVPKAKQTVLGLYVTAKGAYAKWKSNPEKVKILDVRTPEEYVFVGHAPMAKNIPLMFFVIAWDAEKKGPVLKPNADFIAQVKKTYQPEDEILITCRSGQRSRAAVNLLAEAGFKQVYNIIDGMEGDMVKDSASAFQGKRAKNGWKNSGVPWTYTLDPKLVFPPPETKQTPEKQGEKQGVEKKQVKKD